MLVVSRMEGVVGAGRSRDWDRATRGKGFFAEERSGGVGGAHQDWERPVTVLFMGQPVRVQRCPFLSSCPSLYSFNIPQPQKLEEEAWFSAMLDTCPRSW